MGICFTSSFKYKNATALITVLLIVAVVSITAITMQGYLRGEINQTQMLLDSDELYNNVLSAEAWGMRQITENQTVKELSYTNNNVLIKSRIIDTASLFNVNFLYDEAVCTKSDVDKSDEKNKKKLIAKIFQNILINANVEQDVQNITSEIKLSMCAKSYNSENNTGKDLGNKDSRWEYQKAGQLITDISELKLITDINNTVYNNIQDKMVAIIYTTDNIKFNLDNISPDLFAAMAYVDVARASAFLAENINESATDLNSTIKSSQSKLNSAMEFITNQKKYSQDELRLLKSILTVDLHSKASAKIKNKYYVVRSSASKGVYHVAMDTLVVVDKGVRVIWRKRRLQSNV